MEPYEVLLYSLMTEKAVGMATAENKLTFAVSKNANKEEIANAVEKAYKVKVQKVVTQRTFKGLKKAIVRLDSQFSAEEISSRIGAF